MSDYESVITLEGATQSAPIDSDAVISVRNVGKMYRLYDRPQDRLKEQLFWRFGKHYGREFWALRDVSFQVCRGETVGIIGRNGGGKSTLLQLIAGTLAPTAGDVRVAGRVAALLELGSGFNPEFTGRENVFLNGSILGIDPGEMEERFDEIAAFADIGEFIDQPVKLYSSGMALRLAFAVQATVQKDVLIVDEALAVGDEAFQRKCMRTLEQFRDCGGTVLLVSHSVQTIVRQCVRCLFLHNGQLILDGPSKPVTDIYQNFLYGTSYQQQNTLKLIRENASLPPEALLHLMSETSEDTASAQSLEAVQTSPMFDFDIPKTSEITYGSGQAEIFDWGMYDDQELPVNVLIAGRSYTWRFRARFFETAWDVKFGMMLRTVDGIAVSGINSEWEGYRYSRIEKGCVVEASFNLQINLAIGTYFIESGVVGDTATRTSEGGFLHRRLDICALRVVPPDNRMIYGLAYLHPRFEVRYP